MGWLPWKVNEETASSEKAVGIDQEFLAADAPLGKLYSNKYFFKSLRYPLNVEAAEENHWARFDIQELKGTAIAQEESRDKTSPFGGFVGGGSRQGGVGVGGGNFLDNLLDGVAEKASALVTTALLAPIDITNSTVSQYVNELPPALGGVARGVGNDLFNGGKGTYRGLGNIMLYAPHSRQDTLKFNWQGTAVGVAGAALLAGGGSVTGAAASAIKGDNKTLSDIFDQKGTIAEQLGADLIGKSLGNDQLGNITLKAKGQALNPHLEMFFQNVDFRTFTFDFKLSPRSAEEARAIRDIVRMFKYAAAPQYQSSSSGTGLYFLYPNVFDITMFNEEETHRIARSCLTSIQVDHSGSGVNSTFYDDYPVETNLNLVFTELEIMHKDKISEGF